MQDSEICRPHHLRTLLAVLLHLVVHDGRELGEALAQARVSRHGLEHTPVQAACLGARERLRGEVIDTRGIAVVDQIAKDLEGAND